MDRLKGKVAIVTGASKGIGAAIARAYGAEGASVVVNYARSKEGADTVVADIVAAGGKAIAVQADVAKAADVVRLFAETRRAYDHVDVLVNNAGVYEFKPLEAVTEPDFHRHFDINVLGPILAIQEAAKDFGPAGGSVINVSTVATRFPVPNAVMYVASKGALDLVTRALSAELGPRKIRVNTLSPGGVDTEGTRSIGVVGSEFEKQMVGRTALGRFGQPDDIAGAAVFFASDDSKWVTGENLAVSGGYG